MSRNCRIPARGLLYFREGLARGLGGDPVGLEIVLAAEKVVIHPRRMRNCRVDCRAVLPDWFIGGERLVSHGISITDTRPAKASLAGRHGAAKASLAGRHGAANHFRA